MLDRLREFAPALRGEIHPRFGAGAPEHRALIRADLARALNLDDPAVTDLSQPPRPDLWSISISHTHDLGGWVALPKPATLGFDLERRARVREAVIRRMCTPDEVALVRDPALLWSAKEAMFKAIATAAQPTSLSQITVKRWEARGEGQYLFGGDAVPRGLVLATDEFAVALALGPAR